MKQIEAAPNCRSGEPTQNCRFQFRRLDLSGDGVVAADVDEDDVDVGEKPIAGRKKWKMKEVSASDKGRRRGEVLDPPENERMETAVTDEWRQRRQTDVDGGDRRIAIGDGSGWLVASGGTRVCGWVEALTVATNLVVAVRAWDFASPIEIFDSDPPASWAALESKEVDREFNFCSSMVPVDNEGSLQEIVHSSSDLKDLLISANTSPRPLKTHPVITEEEMEIEADVGITHHKGSIWKPIQKVQKQITTWKRQGPREGTLSRLPVSEVEMSY
ncbi:NADH:ubiquinone oxidoreductase [Striga asiatica]|uniref:NADH:ubiquinone oxidoreductase n=1 Tax=Striga asiatica TaxID=4170 RepID=A0A5A7Q3A8_STRAF|nr:NADH:ubiquinone oxidoreductase [Striga asiatica]